MTYRSVEAIEDRLDRILDGEPLNTVYHTEDLLVETEDGYYYGSQCAGGPIWVNPYYRVPDSSVRKAIASGRPRIVSKDSYVRNQIDSTELDR